MADRDHPPRGGLRATVWQTATTPSRRAARNRVEDRKTLPVRELRASEWKTARPSLSGSYAHPCDREVDLS